MLPLLTELNTVPGRYYRYLEYRKIGPEGTARRRCALMLGPPVPSPTGLCALPAGYGLGLCVP